MLYFLSRLSVSGVYVLAILDTGMYLPSRCRRSVMKLTKTQKMILKYNYEFGLVMITPAICAAIVALIPLFMFKP